MRKRDPRKTPVSILARNIVAAWERATEEDRRQGLGWYQNANDLARHLAENTGLESSQTAAVIAALSPQLGWQENVQAASEVLLKGSTHRQTTRNITKARRLLDGEAPSAVFAPPNPARPSGHKVRSFFANISDPTDPWHVTVDRHATDIALGRVYDDRTRPGLGNKGTYEHVAEAYRVAARVLNVLPSEVQAVTWIAHRRIKSTRVHPDQGVLV
jgi:hypothetical protein